MSESLNIINSLIKKVEEFLNIFDLSFLISGFACFTALLIFYSVLGGDVYELARLMNTLLLIITCYMLGLLNFTCGRFLRKNMGSKYRKKFSETLLTLIINNKLEEHIFFPIYINSNTTKDNFNARCLYNRMWSELRQSKDLTPSYTLINRYWVLAATYDGLACASLIWLFTAEIGFHLIHKSLFNKIISAPWINPEAAYWYFISLILIIFVSIYLLCRHEANRYSINQMEELVSSIAYKVGNDYKS